MTRSLPSDWSRHLLTDAYSALAKMQCIQTKTLLDQIGLKAGPEHAEVLSRYPELKSLAQSVQATLPDRLPLLHAIP